MLSFDLCIRKAVYILINGVIVKARIAERKVDGGGRGRLVAAGYKLRLGLSSIVIYLQC